MTDLPGPPRLAARLLRRILPAADRESVMAEMDELRTRRLERSGVAAADRWYRRQVGIFVVSVLLDRLTGRAGRTDSGDRTGGAVMGRGGSGRRAKGAGLDGLRWDLAFAWRQMVKHPQGTLVALTVLALGVGSGTVVFSVVDGVVLRPLPFTAPERLALVETVRLENGRTYAVAPPAYLLWAREADATVEGITAYGGPPGGLDLEGVGDAEHVPAATVDRRFFELLGVEPALGRSFLAHEDAFGGPGAMVLSHELWARKFGSDPAAVGRAARLGGELRTIVGVMPPGFDFPQGAMAWVPLGPELRGSEDVWGSLYLRVVARLRAGSTPTAAAAELTALNAGDPEGSAWGARLSPLHEHLVGGVERALLLLLGAVVLVLLVTCANVGGLLLSRTIGRRRELAVRAALGAGRGRLMSVVLAEGLILAAAAGGLGVVGAHLGLDAVLALAPDDLPGPGGIVIDARVMAFAVGAALATGLVAGLVPALRVRGDVLTDLKEGDGPRDGDRSGGALRSALVIGQVAVTVVLLAGAALLGRSFLALIGQDVGFEPEGLVAVNLVLPDHRYPEPADLVAFYEALERRVLEIPGMEGVALSQNLPLGGRNMTAPVLREGREEPGPPSPVERTSVGYFEALGIDLRQGRTFQPADRDAEAPVAVVSETFARVHFPDGDALGGRIRTYFDPSYAEIVGVVEDVRHGALSAPPPPLIYQLLARNPARGVHLVARTGERPATSFPLLREAIRQVNPGQTIPEMVPMSTLLVRDAAQPRFHALLLGGFAGVALLVSMLGLYGLLASSVLQRRREIGIRMALGADAARVRWLVVAHAVALTGAGLALGLGGALAAGRLLDGLLYGVAPTDLRVFASVSALMLLTAAAAAYPLVRRATRIDPVEALGA